MSSPRHGFDDDEAARQLLRSPPTQAAIGWVESVTDAKVSAWAVLRGGTSSAMYSIDLDDTAMSRLVLRCYVRPELNEEEPDLAGRECAALQVAATTNLATPELIAFDANGDIVGVPAVLMTWLPGQVVWDPKGPMRWLARLAEILPAVHEAERTRPGLGEYFNYEQHSYDPPKWAADPKVWERAVAIFHGPVLETDRCFVHRDYHPGNVLWHRGRITGVVDWQSACIGPPSIDTAHCRANLLRYAPDLADAFTRFVEDSTGRTFHPWADIATIIGMLDGLRGTPPRQRGRRAIEKALADAVLECS